MDIEKTTVIGGELTQEEIRRLAIDALRQTAKDLEAQLDAEVRQLLTSWEEKKALYRGEFYTYRVRGREIKVENFTESLSHTRIPKIALPQFKDCLLYTSPSPRDGLLSRMPSSA